MKKIIYLAIYLLSLSFQHSFAADPQTGAQVISKIDLVPVTGGFDILLYTSDHAGTWDLSGCSSPAVIKVIWNSSYSKDFLSLFLTAKSTGQKVSFAKSGDSDLCNNGDPLVVDLPTLE